MSEWKGLQGEDQRWARDGLEMAGTTTMVRVECLSTEGSEGSWLEGVEKKFYIFWSRYTRVEGSGGREGRPWLVLWRESTGGG